MEMEFVVRSMGKLYRLVATDGKEGLGKSGKYDRETNE